jgi:hypothetical protein
VEKDNGEYMTMGAVGLNGANAKGIDFPNATTIRARSQKDPCKQFAGDNAHTPHWDSDKSELSYGGIVLLKIKQPAKNIRAVLSAFEEQGWPSRTPDPMLGGKNPQRLNDTCRRLNVGQAGLHFSGDGTGTGICWEPTVAKAP